MNSRELLTAWGALPPKKADENETTETIEKHVRDLVQAFELDLNDVAKVEVFAHTVRVTYLTDNDGYAIKEQNINL